MSECPSCHDTGWATIIAGGITYASGQCRCSGGNTWANDGGGGLQYFDREPAPPRGALVGIADEYGTIWSAEPGASSAIGDLVQRDDEETFEVYLERAL